VKRGLAGLAVIGVRVQLQSWGGDWGGLRDGRRGLGGLTEHNRNQV